MQKKKSNKNKKRENRTEICTERENLFQQTLPGRENMSDFA